SIQTAWNDVILRSGLEVFDGNQMLPAMAEIILIEETCSLFVGDVTQAKPPVTLRIVVKLRVRPPVAHRANHKLVQVGVFPSHHDLKQVMQCRQRYAVRDQDASPDRGLDAF